MTDSPGESSGVDVPLTAEEGSLSCPQGSQEKAADSHHHKHHHLHHHRHASHSSRHNHCGTSQRPSQLEQDVRPSCQDTDSSRGLETDQRMSADGPVDEAAEALHPLRPADEDQASLGLGGTDPHQKSRPWKHQHAAHHSHGSHTGLPEPSTEIHFSAASTDTSSTQAAQVAEAGSVQSVNEEPAGSQATPPVHQHIHRHPGHHHQHAHRRQLNQLQDESQDLPPQGERHRLLQDQQRQQHFRANPFNSGLWISIELGFLVSQIVAAIIILPLSIYEAPKDPLGVWVTGYAAGCAALLPLLYWRYSQWCSRDVSASSGLEQPAQGPQSAPATQEDSAGAGPADGDGQALLEMHQPSSTAPPTAGLDVDLEAGLGRRRRSAARRVLCFDMEDPRLPVLIAKYKAALDCFFAMWYVLGSMWVLGGTTTFQDSPMLYSLSMVYMVMSSISYGVPFLLCATICCCLPCIIAVMGSEDIDPARPQGAGLGPGNSKGAAPEAIAALPTFVFRTAGTRVKDIEEGDGSDEVVDVESGGGNTTGAQESGSGKGKELPAPVAVGSSDVLGRRTTGGGGLFGAFTRGRWLQSFRGRGVLSSALVEQVKVGPKGVDGADSDDDADSVDSGEEGLLCAGATEEQRLAGGDAVCCICLAHYRDGAELRRLPCHHHFHASCVDTWLVINGCCPLCKEPIVPGEKKPES